VLNVHVNRMPYSGTVTKVAYNPGIFLSAADDKASDANERNSILLRLDDGRDIGIVQIAGLIARRILCDLREGDRVTVGRASASSASAAARTCICRPVSPPPWPSAKPRSAAKPSWRILR
jgi:phosphatidylserine decarboxylase